jgi:hypothetical protein
MADANTEVDLQAMHDAIVAAITAQFPDFKTVEFYRDDESEQIATPACLLEMTEVEPAPGDDAGTGQWPAHPRFDARIIMSARTPVARMEVRKAAVSFAAWLNLRRFPGIFTDPCQVIACEPDEFAPHLDRFQVWRIEWIMPAMFGDSAWRNDGTVPDAWYSFAPEIGVPHEADYLPLDGPAE